MRRAAPFAGAAATITSNATPAPITERQAAEENWSPVAIDDRRCLIYGPRFGKLYLTSVERLDDKAFRQIVGLPQQPNHALVDPVERFGWSLGGLRDDMSSRAAWRMRLAYRLLHNSRHLLPFRLSAKLIRLAAGPAARRSPGEESQIEAIARAVAATERAVGFSDCYPRTLLSAWLALTAGQPCVVAIGVLAPTRKMHAWCTIAGVLPFEPTAEHYLYQPAWTLTLS